MLVWKAWSVCTRVRTSEIFSEHSTTLSNSEDVSMWLKQKISTSWISYCSKILHLFKSAQTNVKDAFLCFEFSVMDERNRNNPDMLRELSDTEVLYCERIEHCFVNIVALIILKLFLNLMRKLLYTLAPSRHVVCIDTLRTCHSVRGLFFLIQTKNSHIQAKILLNHRRSRMFWILRSGLSSSTSSQLIYIQERCCCKIGKVKLFIVLS